MLSILRKYRNYIAAFVLATVLFVPFAVVWANQPDVDSKEQELKEIQRKIDSGTTMRDSARRKANTAYGLLVEIEAELRIEEGKVNAVIAKINTTEELIEERNEAIEVAQKKLDARIKIYGKRLRDIYKHGQLNYVDILFGSKDFKDFATRLELLKRIIKQDVSIVTSINQARQDLLAERKKLEDYKIVLEKTRAELEPQRQVVLAKRRERAAAYNEALQDKERLDREYNQLMAESKQISEMIRRIRAGGKVGQGTGSMIWPHSGETTSPYGWRIHPIFGTSRYHSGRDIGADYDDPVAAADDGLVVYAGWMGGYGNTVMLDHGGGITTLYAHNNSVNVGVGQTVSQGQTVSFAGSTGYSTGPHVHFEVRKDGEPVDPNDYVR